MADRAPAAGATGVAVSSAADRDLQRVGDACVDLDGAARRGQPGGPVDDELRRRHRHRHADPDVGAGLLDELHASASAAPRTPAATRWPRPAGRSRPRRLPRHGIDDGPGGPIAVVTSDANRSSSYLAEIVRAEGLNEFANRQDRQPDGRRRSRRTTSSCSATSPITDAQVAALTAWVNARRQPDPMQARRAAARAGRADRAGRHREQRLPRRQRGERARRRASPPRPCSSTAPPTATRSAVRPRSPTSTPPPPRPPAGPRCRCAASAPTAGRSRRSPSTSRSRSSRPGRATRPGRAPNRDGMTPNRSNDLFFGGASHRLGQPRQGAHPAGRRAAAPAGQPDHGDERGTGCRCRGSGTSPKTYKAVLVATGDDHAGGGTAGRMSTYAAASPPGCSVALWECARFTSYVYPGSPADQQPGGGVQRARASRSGCTRRTAAPTSRRWRTCSRPTPTSCRAAWSAKYTSLPVADHQPLPLHRVERLGLPAQGRAGERHPAGHELLLLPGLVDPGPSRLHERLGDADAVHRHRRLDDRRLPGQHVDDRRVGAELPVHAEHACSTGRSGPLGYYGAFTANLHTDNATTVRGHADPGVGPGARRAGDRRAPAADLDRRPQRARRSRTWRGTATRSVLGRGRGRRHRSDRHAADERARRPDAELDQPRRQPGELHD